MSMVTSYTKGVTYDIIVSQKFLNKTDKVLIIDDFLAKRLCLDGTYRYSEYVGR